MRKIWLPTPKSCEDAYQLIIYRGRRRPIMQPNGLAGFEMILPECRGTTVYWSLAVRVGSVAMRYKSVRRWEPMSPLFAARLTPLWSRGWGSALLTIKSQDFLSEQTQYDTIFDTIGKHNWKTCSKVLSRQGCFVSTVPQSANLTSMALSRLRNLVGHSQRSEVVMVSSKGTDLEKLTGLIETGQITPLIDSVFPLKDAKQAHDHSRSLQSQGKIILEVQPQGVR